MWENINCCLLAAEIVLLIVGVFYLIGKKTVIRTFLYVGLVFLMTLTVYVVPLYYADFTAEKGVEILVGFFTGIGHTVKQFMGESETEKVYSYAEEFPLYSWVFSLSAVMAIVTTGYATVSIFRRRFFNDIARAGRLKKDYCDIFVGCGEKAVSYAKRSKNVVLLVDEATEKESVVALVDDGCVVMRGKLSPKFLKSRWFKKTKRYNIILSGETENLHIDLATVLQCVSAVYKIKNIHFYLEIDERVAEIVQQQIDAKQKADNVSYREYITLFSLNELVARKFVEENPVTKYMPYDFFEKDTSVKADAKIKVLMVGFGARSKELYKKFVINNQLAVWKNGEYHVFPIDYSIYDAAVEQKEWGIDGLRHALEKLGTAEGEYFPMPELPYNTECFQENLYDMDSIGKVCEKLKQERGFTYIIIDTGDVYRNIEISNNFNLLLNNGKNYRIFMYSNFEMFSENEIICYGNTDLLLTHDVIINESLLSLAKTINKEYLKQYLDPEGKLTDDELDAENKKDWRKASYFNMYSNISLATSLRVKLNSLGLDYVKKSGETASQTSLIEESYGTYDERARSYENYFTSSRRNAMLAQEHFRWNAYHLLNGYLPMKKSRIIVRKTGANNDEVKRVIKNNDTKKHSALTTFNGLNCLSEYIANKANELFASKDFSAKDFDYYKNDELLINVAGRFVEDNNYRIEKNNSSLSGGEKN
ncbi:MAG: hypothetical protein E7412_05970 [Ruminococcaceae bacterium]|nr:hypothetical protein [Oscillospiraceae bacterium]